MKFLDQSLTSSTQWRTYQQLELIPEAIPNSAQQGNPLASTLNLLWRPLLGLLIDELIEEQRVDYLDRCWVLNQFTEEQSASNSLQRFWTLIN